MTAERPGGENPPHGDGLPASPANAETPAVITLCSGFYIISPKDGEAICDVCSVVGPAGERCQQTVIA